MSSSSETSSIRTMAPAPLVRQPSVAINIDGHYNSKIYTSGSAICGEVTINPWRDSRFDHLQILLVGASKTRIAAVQIPTQAQHTFLKLNMPISESSFPVPRVYEAGTTYKIPFNFVIPHHLTVNACNHTALADHVHDCHMRLPPSMGTWERDDLSPDVSHVEYSVKARVLRLVEFGRPVKVMESMQRINVLPSSPEDPPMNITKQDKGYSLSKTKTIRKNLFSGKQGHIVATAAQPSAIHMNADGHGASGSSVLVNLRFDPLTGDISAPKLNAVSAKLQSRTYFSGTPMTKLPNLGDSRGDYSIQQILNYSTTVPLFSTSANKIQWQQQLSSAARRDSGYSSDGGVAAHTDSEQPRRSPGRRNSSKSQSSPVFHTSTLQIPFKLPTSKKMFLPSFHSCLISRVYTLQLALTIGDSKINLSIPLQIAMEPQEMALYSDQDMGLPSFDLAMAQQEAQAADDHLRPRVLVMPAPELQGNSVLPGYDDLSLMMRRPTARAV